jgi:cytochrome P450
MFRDPLATYGELSRRYGDTVRIPLTAKRTFYLLSRPEHFEHVLVQHQDRYVKAFTYRPLKAFLGDGLLTAEGTTWQRHRRLVQPVFSHRHVQAFGPAVVEAARNRVAQWAPGSTIDVATEMRTLTMEVIGRVLFGIDLAGEAEPVGNAVSRLQASMALATLMPPFLSPERGKAVATRIFPALGRAAHTLESLVVKIIDERIAAPHAEPTDLLDLLLAAGQDEQPLSRSEIQDEVMTLVLAGHETTANLLTWAVTLLSRYPATRDRLAVELDDVLGDRDPQASDVDDLHWTQAVVNETMRLYPPAWTVERDATEDDDIAGVKIAAGNTIGLPAYLLHRHPEFWPNPEGFDPRRFLADADKARLKHAFMPFGGGRRICVGASLAQMEATLALSVLAKSVSLDLVATAPLTARADVTLHPAGPVVATVGAPVPASTAQPLAPSL